MAKAKTPARKTKPLPTTRTPQSRSRARNASTSKPYKQQLTAAQRARLGPVHVPNSQELHD
jgi:hypothetical protein